MKNCVRSNPAPSWRSGRCVLSVFCCLHSRIAGTADVELRTIASSIYGALRSGSRFEVDVLRPPAYEALERTLREAASRNDPYGLVHFDGHGYYQSAGRTDAGEEFGGGYLVFEHDLAEHGEPVSGDAFDALATGCGVRAVVLNACRSAYQETTGPRIGVLERPASSFACCRNVRGSSHELQRLRDLREDIHGRIL